MYSETLSWHRLYYFHPPQRVYKLEVCQTLFIMFPSQRQEMPTLDDDSGSDREDELPQVVVLKSGDLTEEEVKKIKEETRPGKDKSMLSLIPE